MKELKTTEGGASAVCEVMQEYENQAVLKMLISMVKDGVVTIAEAAKRANLSEKDFEEQMLIIQTK